MANSSDTQSTQFFDPQFVILASHSARAIDHAGNAKLCVLSAPSDGVHERLIATPPGRMQAVSKDKDHSHSFAFRVLLRKELPVLDPYISGEVQEFLESIVQTLKANPSGEKPATTAERMALALGRGEVLDELLQLQPALDAAALKNAQEKARKKAENKAAKSGTTAIDVNLADTKAEDSANLRKLRALLLAACEDSAAHQAAWSHLQHLRDNPLPSKQVPLRQRIKQLVVPGVGADVVISPMPSLVMLDALQELSSFLEKEAPYAENRLMPWQGGTQQSQNSGVPGIGRARALREVFRLPSHEFASLGWAFRQPSVESTMAELSRALRHRRVYRKTNAIGEGELRSRSDIDRALESACQSLCAALDEALAGLPEFVFALRRPQDARDQYLDLTLQALKRQARSQGGAMRAEVFLSAQETAALMAAWDSWVPALQGATL